MCTDCSMHFNENSWFYISLSVVGMTILDIWSVKIVMDPFDGGKNWKRAKLLKTYYIVIRTVIYWVEMSSHVSLVSAWNI